MNVYIYKAALLCEDCGLAVRQELDERGESPEDSDDEGSYDSDVYPKGPYADGGGEADEPQHCDMADECLNAEQLSNGSCVGAFLENDLTSDGVRYVKDAIRGKGLVAREIWGPAYDLKGR